MRTATEGEAYGPKFFADYFESYERLLAHQQELLKRHKSIAQLSSEAMWRQRFRGQPWNGAICGKNLDI